MSVEKREALKMGNEALVSRAKRVVAKKMDGRKQADVAKELGVVSAHLHRLLKQDYLSPTLKQAMMDAGWLVVNRRSPRISIQRDDPEAAARSIINLAGKEVARALARELRRQAGGIDNWALATAPPMNKCDGGTTFIPVIAEPWLRE